MVKIFHGKGKRKKAVGNAILKIPGTGKIKVNNRDFVEYFQDPHHRTMPLLGIFALGQSC